jgi:hypothetical protein
MTVVLWLIYTVEPSDVDMDIRMWDYPSDQCDHCVKRRRKIIIFYSTRLVNTMSCARD